MRHGTPQSSTNSILSYSFIIINDKGNNISQQMTIAGTAQLISTCALVLDDNYQGNIFLMK